MENDGEVPQMTFLYTHFYGYWVSCHWMKGVSIQRFYGPYFPAFGLNTER